MKKVFSLLLVTVIFMSVGALPGFAANGEDFKLDFEVWNPVAGDGSEIQWSAAKTELVPRNNDVDNHVLKLTSDGLDVRNLGFTGDTVLNFDFMFPSSVKKALAEKYTAEQYLSDRFMDVRFGNSFAGSNPLPVLFQYYAGRDTMMLDISSDEEASYKHTRVANFGFDEWHNIGFVFHSSSALIDVFFDGIPFTKAGVNFRVYPDNVKNLALNLISCKAPFKTDGGELYIDNFSVGSYTESEAHAETLSGNTSDCTINEGLKVIFAEKMDDVSITLNNVDYTACFEKSEDGKIFTYNGYRALDYGTEYTLTALGTKGLGTVSKAVLSFVTIAKPSASTGSSSLYTFDDGFTGNANNVGTDSNAKVEIIQMAKDGNVDNKVLYIKNGTNAWTDGEAQFGLKDIGMKGTIVYSFDFMLPLSMKDKLTSDIPGIQGTYMYFKQADGKIKGSVTNTFFGSVAEGENTGNMYFRGADKSDWKLGGRYTFGKWHHVDMVIESEYGSFDVYFDGVKSENKFNVIAEDGSVLKGSEIAVIKGVGTNLSEGEMYLDNVKVSEAISNIGAKLNNGLYTSKLVNKSVSDETVTVIVTVSSGGRLEYINIFEKTVPSMGESDLSEKVPEGNVKIMFWKSKELCQPYSRYSLPLFER